MRRSQTSRGDPCNRRCWRIKPGRNNPRRPLVSVSSQRSEWVAMLRQSAYMVLGPACMHARESMTSVAWKGTHWPALTKYGTVSDTVAALPGQPVTQHRYYLPFVPGLRTPPFRPL